MEMLKKQLTIPVCWSKSGRHLSSYAKLLDHFPFTDDIQVIVTGHVETVCLLSQRKPDTTIEVDLDISEFEVSSAETKATYEERL